ncbi:hypothetical protein B484DRAFT_303197, partial [Ochromonadaceae sp. CCMP2298]
GGWLGDEALDFMMGLLGARDDNLCKCSAGHRRGKHFFSTFFYDQIANGEGRTWTKKFDIFEQAALFLPINLNNCHWTLIVVNMIDRTIIYYDSMGSPAHRPSDWERCEVVRRWLIREACDPFQGRSGGVDAIPKISFTLPPFEIQETFTSIPQQQNGFDCGVFVVTACSFLADSPPLQYGQVNMESNRIKIASAI